MGDGLDTDLTLFAIGRTNTNHVLLHNGLKGQQTDQEAAYLCLIRLCGFPVGALSAHPIGALVKCYQSLKKHFKR